MKIETLPNTLTDYDKKQIQSLQTNLVFSPYRYDTNETIDIMVKEITDSDNLIATVEASRFSLGAKNNRDVQLNENVSLEHLIFIPNEHAYYQDFKRELVLIPMFNEDGDVNTKEHLLNEHFNSICNDVKSFVTDNYENSDVLIICPSTRTYLEYRPNQEHVFHVDLSGDTFEFDSIDLALKGVYEWAKYEMEYKPESLRARLAKLDEYMETEEFEQSVKEFFQKEDEKNQELDNFFESERFNDIYQGLIEKELVNSNLSGFEMQHGNGSPVLSMDEFHLFTQSLLRNIEHIEDEDSTFPCEYIIYKNIRIEQVHGQGTETIISLNN